MRGSTAGLPDLPPKGGSWYYSLLVAFDYVFAAGLITPLVVGYWRSVWELLEIYVYPEEAVISATISTLIGIVGHLFFTLTQSLLEKRLHPDRGRLQFYALSRLYTYAFSFVCVNGWRGPWHLMDHWARGLDAMWASTIGSVVVLAVLRTLRNMGGAPFALVVDRPRGYFEVVTMFRTAPKEKTSLYILDCLFSVLVVGTLVVFVWRGAFMLFDIYLFPENNTWSAWGSLILGYGVVVICFLLQPLMRYLCDHIDGVIRVIIADVFLLFSFFGTVNVWRGIWSLLNIYFLPDNIELSCWICHWICFILLVLLKCSNTLLVRGVYIDAEEPAGKCVVFPVYYLRLIFQHERVKKANRKFQMEEMARRKLELEGVVCSNTDNNSIRKDSIKREMENHCHKGDS